MECLPCSGAGLLTGLPVPRPGFARIQARLLTANIWAVQLPAGSPSSRHNPQREPMLSTLASAVLLAQPAQSRPIVVTTPRIRLVVETQGAKVTESLSIARPGGGWDLTVRSSQTSDFPPVVSSTAKTASVTVSVKGAF